MAMTDENKDMIRECIDLLEDHERSMSVIADAMKDLFQMHGTLGNRFVVKELLECIQRLKDIIE